MKSSFVDSKLSFVDILLTELQYLFNIAVITKLKTNYYVNYLKHSCPGRNFHF